MTTQRTLQQRIYATMYPTARIAAFAAAGSLLAADSSGSADSGRSGY